MSIRNIKQRSQYNNKEYIITGILTITTFCLGTILSSTVTNADPVSTTSSANASVIVSSACSMTYNTVTPHTITMTNNTTSSDVGTTTLTATCNDPSGLAIYAVGYSGDEYGNTNLIGTTGNIATGTDNATSNWSMRLYTATGSITPSSITDTFSAVPSTYTKFAEISSGTTGASALAVNATYKFYISGTQPADTYTGKVKYTMVHPATEIPPQPQTTQAGKICYYPNGIGVVGTMGCQTIPTNGGSIHNATPTQATLLASNFSRSGYGFAGWNTEYDYTGTFYGPNETIYFTEGQYSGANPGLSLYAVWIESEGSLQDSSRVATVCNRLTKSGPNVTPTLNSVSALTDQRDYNTYAIAKLADDKCWMIENLRLDNTNSDNSTGTLAQGYGTSATYGNFSGLAEPETENFIGNTTANSIYFSGTQNGTASIDIGTTNYPGYRFPRYNNQNTASRASSPTTKGNNIYGYGNNYTWAAAIADTADYSSGDHGTTSICPLGWRLPIGDQTTTDKSFGALSVALGGPAGGANADSSTTPTGAEMSNVFRSYPNNFLFSGAFFNSSFYNRNNSQGSYWSSTKKDRINGNAYLLILNDDSISPNAYGGAYWGRYIRCLANY